MTIFTDVQIALDDYLNDLGLSVGHAWPNVDFTPTEGTSYIRPTLLHTPSTLLDLEKDQVNQGLYQIDVFCPTGTGPKVLLDILGSIYNHFKSQNSLSSGTATVYLREVSTSPFERDGIWYTGNITVAFTYYSN